MPKKKLEDLDYPTTSVDNETTLKHLQDTFADRVDPDVVYFILADRNYDLDSTLHALLTISNEIQDEPDPEPEPKPPQNEDICGGILRLSEILNSPQSSRLELRNLSPPDPTYAALTSLYLSNEALYSEEVVTKHCTVRTPPEKQTPNVPPAEPAPTKQKINYTPGKNDLTDVLSPQSDCSIEADASDIIQSALESSIAVTTAPPDPEPIEKKQSGPSETSDSIPLASNRPFYYFPFVTPFNQLRRAKKSPLDQVLGVQHSVSKLLVLLRGLPGSGKSTLASELALLQGGVVCSSDYYFTRGNRYDFDPSKLAEAHEWNQRRAKKLMEDGEALVVIDNTNVEGWEMRPYVMYAQRYGYRVEILEPDTPWRFKPRELARRNVHGITKEKIQHMLDRYETNLTVESILALPPALDKMKAIAGGPPDERTASCCDSPRIPSEYASPPTSPARNLTVQMSPVNFNNFNKWPRKNESKVQNAAWKLQKRATKTTTPKQMSAITGTAKSHTTSRDVVCQTESPTEAVIFGKNALDNVKNDYLDDDEDFWGFDDRSAARKDTNRSPHRARNRTRQSKGDPRAMEEIARTNAVVHEITLAEEDVHLPLHRTETRTKIGPTLAAPFVHYSREPDSDPEQTDSFVQTRRGYRRAEPRTRAVDKTTWTGNSHPEEPRPEMSHVIVAIDRALNLIDRGTDTGSGREPSTRKRSEMDSDRSDEDELGFQLEPAFASQLEQLFGSPGHYDESSERDLDIKINLNLAWQIHKCWARSVQRKLYEEDCEFVRLLEERENPRRGSADRYRRSVSLDRKRSRSCDLSDTRDSRHRMEKTDSVPNMRDIMDLELALQMSREDATEKERSIWNDVDLATKMKRNLLFERYPYLDRNSLDEVFAANNFSLPETEEQIHGAFGGELELPPHGRSDVHATNGEVQRSGLVRKVSTMRPPVKRWDSLLTPVVEGMQDFRAESELYHQLRHDCFDKAREAYRSGRRGAASFYAQQGHTYTQKIWEANRRASMKILVHRNLGRDSNTIDLHLLYVREAVQMLDIFLKIKLDELLNSNDRRSVIAVITGRGKHSIDQVPRLKRGVINYLCKKNITYHEKQAGLIEVILTRKEKL